MFCPRVYARALVVILTLSTAGSVLPARALDESAKERVNASEYLPAIYALNNANYDIASNHLERASQSDPDNSTLLNQHMSFALRTQRLSVAARAAEQVLALEGSDSNTLANLILATLAIRDEDYEDALDFLASAEMLRSYVPSLALLKAVSLAALDNEVAALRAIRTIGETEGWEDAGLIFEILFLHKLDRSEEAIAIGVGSVDDAALNVPQAVLIIGALLQESGRAEEAEALYVSSLARSSGEYLLRDRLFELRAGRSPSPLLSSTSRDAARFLTELARIQASVPSLHGIALDSISLALVLSGSEAEALYVSGSLWEVLGDHRAALSAFGSIPLDSALGWQSVLQRAQILMRREDYDDARDLLVGLSDRGEHHDRVFLLGHLYRFQEEWPLAAEAYGEALARYPGDGRDLWYLHYLRGIAYERNDQWEQAEDDFLRALELEPDEANVLNYLAYTWTDQGRNLDEALEMLERAIASEPDAGHIIDSLGWVYYKLSSFDLATRYLEAASSYLPGDAVVNDHLGDAYWRSGRFREARIQWRRALEADDHPEGEGYLREKLEKGLDGAF
ncbi:MAG: tetratricopeptide repeat protein [Alphaproteobacteria bacterium]